MNHTDTKGPQELLRAVTAERDVLKADRKKLIGMMNDAAIAAGHDGYDEDTELWRSVCSHLDRLKAAAAEAMESVTAERDVLDEELTVLNGQYDSAMVKLAKVEAERDAALVALRRLSVTSVTANPGVLHHFTCALCGGRWSGRPDGTETHSPNCLATKLP